MGLWDPLVVTSVAESTELMSKGRGMYFKLQFLFLTKLNHYLKKLFQAF